VVAFKNIIGPWTIIAEVLVGAWDWAFGVGVM
jgi:hypothetical protein